MDSIFKSMFCRDPEQILCGDYYFKNSDIPGFDNTYTTENEATDNGLNPEEVLKKRKDRIEQEFLPIFNRFNLASEYEDLPKKTRELIPEDDIIDLGFTDFLYVLRKPASSAEPGWLYSPSAYMILPRVPPSQMRFISRLKLIKG